MANSSSIKLNSGYDMPQVGLGLWKIPRDECPDTVYRAIKAGYRLFDGAFDYGNEKEVGEGIRRAISDGLVKRGDLFITSKLWNTFHEPERVEPIVRQQLEWWGIDYFDLFLIHFPVALEYVDPKDSYPSGWSNLSNKIKEIRVPLQETWKALEALVDKGLVRSIGVSNYSGGLVMDLLRYCRIRPAALQVEHHPYLVQPNLIALAKQEGIAVTAYSSFGPMSFIELGWEKSKAPSLFEHPLIKKIAESHGKTPAQVLLRWATQRGLAVIPKSNTDERLMQNLNSLDFKLKEDEIASISGLDKNLRFNDPVDYLGTLHIFA